MFSPKVTPRANISSFSRTKTPLASHNNRGTPKSFTPQRWGAGTPSFRNSPTVGNWSFQAEETTTQRLELFGNALPVLVTEALTQCNKTSDLSVEISPQGWAWLIWGHKLLLWKYISVGVTKGYSCKELVLPSCDAPHTAALVTLVGGGDEGGAVGCVAVSPAGTVRYWSNVAHEGSYVDVSCAASLAAPGAPTNLCAAVMATRGPECVIATESSSLILVTLPNQRQSDVRCRLLQVPHGMLSGIGRRVTSLFFGGGGGSNQAQIMPFTRLVCGEVMDGGAQAFYVLATSQLQKWAILNGTEKMLYQCDVGKMMTESIASTVWNQSAEQLSSLQVWLLDIQATYDGMLLVGAAVNPEVSTDIHYGIGNLHTEGSDSPQSFMSFTVPKFTDAFTGERPEYRLVVPDPSAPTTAYLHDKHTVFSVSVTSSSRPVDKVEFHAAGDGVLGAGVSTHHQALFFSLVHGLVTMRGTGLGATLHSAAGVSHHQHSFQETMVTDQNTSQMDTTIGPIDVSKVHELSVSGDRAQRLKAAFLQSLRKNMNEAEALVQELLSDEETEIDRLVIGLSQEMIDECPVTDPRWAESVPHCGMGGSGSLILQHQLEDKLKAHRHLITFLKTLNIWQELTVVKEEEVTMETRLLLAEHAEKIAAAIALRALHMQYGPLVDAAIERVLDERGVKAEGALTPNDIFYREVSRVGEVLAEVVEYEDVMLHGHIKPQELVSLVSATNHVLLGCLGAVIEQRGSEADTYSSERPQQVDYVPWTASTGERGVRTLLLKQYDLTLREGIREASTEQERAALYQHLMELANRILEGYTAQLQGTATSRGQGGQQELRQQYQDTRTALITPLVTEQQYERAASLAEKYCEFGVLVQLCESTGDEDRLLKYMNTFHARGFAEFVFKWYVKEGLRGKLLASAALSSHPHLARFLAHGDNKDMSWLHHVHANNFCEAHNNLHELAMDEKQFLAKKKTLLSLSKLCALAADDEEGGDEALNNTETNINPQLELITHQEQLPQSVLESLGQQADSMPVMSTKEIIEHYTGTHNQESNEFDFKKALDLLPYMDKNDVDYDAMVLHIWCQAIAKDDWSSISTDHPLENSKDTIFFKTVELAYTDGLKLQDYLPTVERLLACDQLGPLQHNPNFQYLLRAGYEQIQRILT